MSFRHYALIALAALGLSACQQPPFQHDFPAPAGAAKPWTATPFNAHAGDFQFALVGDRTGLARPGVFEHAISRLNLLQPEFVINVGDMIEGYSDDPAELKREWDEQDARLQPLQMPFFRVVGNHDMGSQLMREFWRDRYGPDYYAFTYKNVLFLVLNSEDPPTPMPASMREGFERIKQLLATDPEAAKAVLAKSMSAMTAQQRKAMHDMASPANFSDAQIAWAQRVLAQHRDVRWTFVFMHKPAWEMDSPGFVRIERLLAGRAYTVFGGHEHNYAHSVRDGHDYIRLGTVGGGLNHPPPGNLDHVTVVSLRADQPHIVNLALDGVLDKNEPQQRP